MDVSWAQELCIFMFVWMAKFGAAYGVRTGIHVGVDVIIRKLSGTPQKAAGAGRVALAGALFTGIGGHAQRQLRLAHGAHRPGLG